MFSWNPVIVLVPKFCVVYSLVCKGATQGSLGVYLANVSLVRCLMSCLNVGAMTSNVKTHILDQRLTN